MLGMYKTGPIWIWLNCFVLIYVYSFFVFLLVNHCEDTADIKRNCLCSIESHHSTLCHITYRNWLVVLLQLKMPFFCVSCVSWHPHKETHWNAFCNRKKQKLVLASTIAVQSLQLKHTHTQTYFTLTIKFLNMQQVQACKAQLAFCMK